MATMFSVWVGGVEVNDYYLPLLEAQDLAHDFTRRGYDDVCLEPRGWQEGEIG